MPVASHLGDFQAVLGKSNGSPAATETYVQEEAKKIPSDLLLGPDLPLNKVTG